MRQETIEVLERLREGFLERMSYNIKWTLGAADVCRARAACYWNAADACSRELHKIQAETSQNGTNATGTQPGALEGESLGRLKERAVAHANRLEDKIEEASDDERDLEADFLDVGRFQTMQFIDWIDEEMERIGKRGTDPKDHFPGERG